MSLLAVKAYFENVGKSQGLTQVLDPFGDLEVATTKLKDSFHVLVESTRGVNRQNQQYDLQSNMVFTIYQNSGKDVNTGMNKLISRCETILVDCMNTLAENGVNVVLFDRIDYQALSETKNDNVLIGRLNFNVKHFVCLDQ